MASRDKTDGEHVRQIYRDIYRVVRRIPRGRVATYGQVAELAGYPGAARVAGAAMRASAGRRVPWQRVVGRRSPTVGKVAILDPIGGATQRELLEAEGVEFTDTDGIPMRDFGWLPVDEPGHRRPRRSSRAGRNEKAPGLKSRRR